MKVLLNMELPPSFHEVQDEMSPLRTFGSAPIQTVFHLQPEIQQLGKGIL